jgi:hypothetical protein
MYFKYFPDAQASALNDLLANNGMVFRENQFQELIVVSRDYGVRPDSLKRSYFRSHILNR